MNKLNCWEFMKCEREIGGANTSKFGICPTSLDMRFDGIHNGTCGGRACWAVAGTLCSEQPMGTFAQKISNCKTCKFYQYIKADEGDRVLPVNAIMNKIKTTDIPRHISKKNKKHKIILPPGNAGIETSFHEAVMHKYYGSMYKCGYRESRFLHMVGELGAIEAVKKMLKNHQFIYGLNSLKKCNCMEFAIENLVVEPEFATIFSEEEKHTAMIRLGIPHVVEHLNPIDDLTKNRL